MSRNRRASFSWGAARLAACLIAACALGCRGPDSRYLREIEFEGLDVTVSLEGDARFLRCDGAVDDMEAHTRKLLAELGLDARSIRMTNPGRFGRQMCVPLEGGGLCSFIWVLDDPDPLIVTHRLNHERFHAVSALQPESIGSLSRRAREMGYAVDLEALDEELAATVVGILTIYAGGSPIVVGTGGIMEAVELLERSRIDARSG